MLTFFLSLILLLSIILFLLKKRKIAPVLLSIFVVIFILQGSGVITSFLLKKLQEPYILDEEIAWKKNNIIILLGAGIGKAPGENAFYPGIFGYPRILKTAQLYSSCNKSSRQCTIIISGGDALNLGISEAENYHSELIKIGVNEKDIINETKSKNTYQNAEFTAKILKEKRYDQLILVTSGLHLKRSLLYFLNFNLLPKPAMADYLSAYISYIPIGYNSALTDLALHEYEGILRFYIYNYMGWNK